MKTKIGKGSIFAALAAVLLATTVLIASCSGPSGGSPQNGYNGPDGTGAVKINTKISEGVPSRTILPDLDPTSDFSAYTLSFAKKTDDDFDTDVSPAITVTRTAITSLASSVYLEPGYWTLTLTAFSGVDLVATGTVNFTLLAGEEESLTVPLGPVIATGDTGTFTWNINLTSLTPAFGGASDDLTLKITPFGSTTFSPNPYAAFTSIKTSVAGRIANDSISISTGYYDVDLVLTFGTGQTVTVHDVLHIYKGEESEWALEVKNGQFFGWTKNPIQVSLDGAPVLVGSGAVAIANITSEDTFDDPIELSKDTANAGAGRDVEVITVTNASNFTSLQWYVNSDSPEATTGSPFTITAGTGSFVYERTYLVGVVGTKNDGTKYSTNFWVTITY